MKIRFGISSLLLVACLGPLLGWCETSSQTAAYQTASRDDSAHSPVVRKIDPPNWWTDFTPDLTLLLTGENLTDAHAETTTAGATIVDSHSSSNGHYLFIHLRLSSSVKPGNISLSINSRAASTRVALPISERADPKGHFEGFNRDDVIYLIMPDRFADGDATNDQPVGSVGVFDRSNPGVYHGGDIRGVHDHLSYLRDLGMTTLWITPVWKNTDSDYHGYHCVDFYAVDPRMGTMQDYQSLVADAHKLGMKVLIDFVANHTGPKHPWANDPPTPTWFHGTPEHHLEPSYKFNGLVDPHASPRESRNTLDGWFANKLPDLNPDDPPLGLYLAQNILWWTEIAQLDGYRLDTFPYSSRSFWSGWHERVHQVYPKIDDIGEVADPDSSITAFFEGGRKRFDGIDSGLSTVFDFPLRDALRDTIIKGDSMQKVVTVLQHDQFYAHPEMLVTFFGNHDDGRFLGVKDSSPAKLKAAFSLLLTLRGIPQIYYGDEIGMTGGGDPDNRRDFPGGFPGDSHNAFMASGRTPEQQDMFLHVQSLLKLRREHPALRTGKQWHIGWDDSYYAFVRESPEEKLFVVYNNAADTRSLDIPVADTPMQRARELQPIFGSSSATVDADKVHLSLPAWSMAVFAVR